MKLPWTRDRAAEQERDVAEMRVEWVRGHLRVLLNELETLLQRTEDHHRRGHLSDE